MRLYSASSEETLRARTLIKDWAGEGILTKEQHQRLEQDTVSELRTTNIFLRLVLLLFTLISVCAAAALFFQVFLRAFLGANRRHFPADRRCRQLCRRRACRFPGPFVSLWDRGSARRRPRLDFFAGNAVRFIQRPSFAAGFGRSPLRGSRRRRSSCRSGSGAASDCGMHFSPQ